MASFRNAIQRRTHKERSQLSSRKHLGLLEHHKDYKQRAVNYHKKQDLIHKLQQKADLKNPDEFYTRMHNEQTTNGIHKVSQSVVNRREQFRQKAEENQTNNKSGGGKKKLNSQEQIRRLKQQDYTYLTMKQQEDQRALVKMKASLHNASKKNSASKHIKFEDLSCDHDDLEDTDEDDEMQITDDRNQEIEPTFDDSADEKQQQQLSSDEHKSTDELDISTETSFSKPYQSIAAANAETFKTSKKNNKNKSPSNSKKNIIINKTQPTRKDLYKLLKQQRVNTKLLKQHTKRCQKIVRTKAHIAIQRELMKSGGKVRKLVKHDRFGDVDPSKTVYKWKQERKK